MGWSQLSQEVAELVLSLFLVMKYYNYCGSFL